jgi:hypothetical protein
MKVGDLVIRKKGKDMSSMIMRQKLGLGIVLSLQPGGRNPVHPCATVYYPTVGKTWDIAVSLVEVVSECR